MNTTNPITDFSHPVAIVMATRWFWTDNKSTLIQRVHGLLQALVDADLYLSDEYEKLQRRGTLTPKGLQDAAQGIASKSFVAAWRNADMDGWRAIQRTIGELERAMIPAPDKTDVAAAVLRSDMRRLWMALDTGPQMGLLLNPTRDLAAALLEVPPALIGLAKENADLLQDRLGESQFPEQTAAIADLEGVKVFAGSVMTMVQGDVMKVLGLDSPAFEAMIWGGALPPNSQAFRLNASGYGPAIPPTPGDVTGISTDVIYR